MMMHWETDHAQGVRVPVACKYDEMILSGRTDGVANGSMLNSVSRIRGRSLLGFPISWHGSDSLWRR